MFVPALFHPGPSPHREENPLLDHFADTQDPIISD